MPKKLIVVGVDGSEASLAALREANLYAGLMGAELRTVTTWEYEPFQDPGGYLAPEEDAKEIGTRAVHAVFGKVIPGWVTVSTKSGSAGEALIEESERAELLVVGTRGRSGTRALVLGSVSRRCAEHSRRPVLVVRDPGSLQSRPDSGRKIVVVGVDGSDDSLAALREAKKFAQLLNAELRCVTTWKFVAFEDAGGYYDPEKDAMETGRDAARAVFGTVIPTWVNIVTKSGPAAVALVDESERADLLVVGTRGHNAVGGFVLGSVSTHCAEHAKGPVLVVPAHHSGTSG